MTWWKWSKTAATNATSDSTINWAEGQAPSSVNDSARGMMAAAAKWRDDISGTLTTGGTSTAYTVTSNQVFDTLAHMDGAILALKFNADSGAAPTLAVDGLTAKALNLTNGVAVPTAYFKASTRYLLSYDNSNNQFLVINPFVAALLTSGIITNAMLGTAIVNYANIQNVNPGKLLGGSLAPGGAAGAVAEQIIPFGQCQLTKSSTNLLLSPYRGNLVTINSKVYAVPDSGPTLSPPAETSTLQYIYVYDNSGTLALEASHTAYATQAGTGIKIKSGDATRTLVGLARTDASQAWADSATQRFVRSWFNDPGVALTNNFTANRTNAATTYTEVNTEIRIEFLVWTGETMTLALNGQMVSGSANGEQYAAIGIDGATAEDAFFYYENVTATSLGGGFTVPLYKTGLSEGYHYATLTAKTGGAGTTTFSGGATAGLRTTLKGYAKL